MINWQTFQAVTKRTFSSYNSVTSLVYTSFFVIILISYYNLSLSFYDKHSKEGKKYDSHKPNVFLITLENRLSKQKKFKNTYGMLEFNHWWLGIKEKKAFLFFKLWAEVLLLYLSNIWLLYMRLSHIIRNTLSVKVNPQIVVSGSQLVVVFPLLTKSILSCHFSFSLFFY